MGQIVAIILATSFVQLANGFFTTFVALRFGIEEFNPALEGLVMSSYFVGFTLGAAACGPLIGRIGHIRSYAAYAAIVIAASSIMALNTTLLTWGVSRAAVGFGCVGIFVTTESWLNSKASSAARGRTFATYMIGTFVALAVGQLLIGRITIEGSVPFTLISTLFATAIIIVSMTRAEAPKVAQEDRVPLSGLVRAAPLAIAGCVVAGLIGSTFYAVAPAWMLLNEIPQSTIGLIMLAAVLGGLAFQVPAGWASDRYDRRLVLGVVAAGFACAAMALVFLPRSLSVVLPVAAIMGGFMSTLYPVSVAHAMDNITGKNVIANSSGIILLNGLGSIFGPFVGSWLMGRFDINALLYFMAAAAGILGAAALSQTSRNRVPSPQHPLPALSPQGVQIAPLQGKE